MSLSNMLSDDAPPSYPKQQQPTHRYSIESSTQPLLPAAYPNVPIQPAPPVIMNGHGPAAPSSNFGPTNGHSVPPETYRPDNQEVMAEYVKIEIPNDIENIENWMADYKEQSNKRLAAVNAGDEAKRKVCST
jgi:hypothetical protein